MKASMAQDIGSHVLLYGKNRHPGKVGTFYAIQILHLKLKKQWVTIKCLKRCLNAVSSALFTRTHFKYCFRVSRLLPMNILLIIASYKLFYYHCNYQVPHSRTQSRGSFPSPRNFQSKIFVTIDLCKLTDS